VQDLTLTLATLLPVVSMNSENKDQTDFSVGLKVLVSVSFVGTWNCLGFLYNNFCIIFWRSSLSAVLVYLASLMLKSLGLGSIHCSHFGTELSSRICYYGLEGKSSSKTSLL
jgi:hypothetical protein